MRVIQYLRNLGGPMTTMGAGLLVAYAGFAADFYKHEIEKASAELESVWSPVHLPIFLGMAIVALGFLWAWRRMSAPSRARPA